MIVADEEGDGTREESLDSMDQRRTTNVWSQFYSLYDRNATEMARYVHDQHRHGNNNEHQQLNKVANDFSTSVSSVIHSSSDEWPGDSNLDEDLFMAMMDVFNETYGNGLTNLSAEVNSSRNSTSFGGDSSSSPHLMPWPQRTSWIVIFAVLVIVAAVGNSLVAWIVFAHKRMKTVTNYFLVNLSLADLTMSVFNCVFNFTFMLNNHWPFGGFYCTVNNFVANVTVAASVFTLVAISFDRYIAIVHPLRPRMSKSTARIAISLIWLASCTLAIPCLLYSQTLSHSYRGGEVQIICIIVWPDGLPSVSQQDFIYNIVFTVSTYLIPVIVMGACYSRMGYVLWRGKSIGEQNQRQVESIQSKHKVVKMFMVIVTLFVVCWLPYHGYFVYQFIDDKVISYKYTQHIFLSFYWLAMSNTMINPLVYYYMNGRFREHFRTTLCCGKRSSTLTLSSTVGSAIIITRAGQRLTPILRNDRADFVTGPRQPRQGLNQQSRGAAVVTQRNGIDANISSPHDVTYLEPTRMHQTQQISSSEVNQIEQSDVIEDSEKSEMLLDCHHQPQRLLVCSETSSVGNGLPAWISSQGHLVTVWTPSESSFSTGREQDNNRQQNSNVAMNRIDLVSVRINIRPNPANGCDEPKMRQNVTETKT